jgi:hypothetical protein
MGTMSKLEENILGSQAYNSDLEIKTIQYDPNGKPNSQKALDQAEHEGLTVVYPKDNEIMIDIDNPHSLQLFYKQMDIVKKYIGVIGEEQHLSKSGGEKWHITVTLTTTVTPLERLALQAMLGSDRVRELLGYVEYKNNDPTPTLFLERKPNG